MKPPSFKVDAKDLDKKIDELLVGKEGRKVLRRSSQVALEPFNDATVKIVNSLKLKPSGRGWRKALRRKSSAFKFRWTGLESRSWAKTGNNKFSATTGVNYKIKVLKLTHLVEAGFRHIGGRVPGNFFREKAFDQGSLKSMKHFRHALYRSYQYLIRTGKAPGLKQTRSFR